MSGIRRLFHAQGARSVRVRWMLEELELAYELAEETLGQPSAALKEAHPLGRIPVFVDGDVVLRESTAAIDYLARSYGDGRMALGPDEVEFPRYLEWLHAAEGTVMPPILQYLMHAQLLPEDQRISTVAESGRTRSADVLAWLDREMAGRSFVAGDRMTAADVTLGYVCYIGRFAKLLDDRYSELRRYWNGLKSRPAAQRALAAPSS